MVEGGGVGSKGLERQLSWRIGSLRENRAQWEASGTEGVRVVYFLNHTGHTREELEDRREKVQGGDS